MTPRHIALVVVVSWISVAPALAQFKEWESKQDLFAANFPGEPTVTSITWETEYGARLPARVYTVSLPGPRTYSVTVVNYNPVRDMLTAQAKNCADQTSERCTGHTSFPGAGYWKNDVRGAMIFAAAKYLKRDITLGHYAWSFLGTQSVENNELQFVNNKDKSRTFVNIFMHHSILYIMEETLPANAPPPGLFVQSMLLKESDGTLARHWGVYFNGATIDPEEAKTCSSLLRLGEGAQPFYAGPTCESLPAAVRFQQGPAPVLVATPAPAAR